MLSSSLFISIERSTSASITTNMKTLATLSILLLAMFAFACADKTTWTPIDQSHFHIVSVTITPDPPVIGKNVTIVIKGFLNEKVTNGTAFFTVFFNLNGQWVELPTSPYTFNICDAVQSCPLAVGPLSVSQTVTVPDFTPPGQYKGVATLNDQNGSVVVSLSWMTTLS